MKQRFVKAQIHGNVKAAQAIAAFFNDFTVYSAFTNDGGQEPDTAYVMVPDADAEDSVYHQLTTLLAPMGVSHYVAVQR